MKVLNKGLKINLQGQMMNSESLDEMTTEAIESYLEDENIKKIQKIILANQDKIEAKIKEYSALGYAFEVRNLRIAIRNAQEPVGQLTEWQAFNLDWCYEIMNFCKL